MNKIVQSVEKKIQFDTSASENTRHRLQAGMAEKAVITILERAPNNLFCRFKV